MIKSFNCKEAKRLFEDLISTKIPVEIQRTCLRKLEYLHAASNINDLRVPPGNKLKKLNGKLKERFSIRVNDQWRICFIWNNGNAYRVEIIDYH